MDILKYKEKNLLYFLGLLVIFGTFTSFYMNINKYLVLGIVLVIVVSSNFISSNCETKNIKFIYKAIIYIATILLYLVIFVKYDPKYFGGKIDNFLFLIDSYIPLYLYLLK